MNLRVLEQAKVVQASGHLRAVSTTYMSQSSSSDSSSADDARVFVDVEALLFDMLQPASDSLINAEMVAASMHGEPGSACIMLICLLWAVFVHRLMAEWF